MRAEDGAQTRDPQLGRLMLYQLSYFRISLILWARIRTTEGVSQQIYSLPHLATLVLALSVMRAEDGAQTRDPQLGRLMLYQLSYFRISLFLWAKMDSNHRRRKPADLQSAPFGHSGICPLAFEILTTGVAFFNCDAKIQLFF